MYDELRQLLLHLLLLHLLCMLAFWLGRAGQSRARTQLVEPRCCCCLPCSAC